jgi:hypothetical protein
MAYRISQPLAVTQFSGDDNKKKPKKKKQPKNQQSMMLDTSGGGLSDAQIAAQNAKKAERKSDRDRKKEVRVKKRTERQSDRTEKKIKRAKKREVNPEYIKKEAEKKEQKKLEKEGAKSFKNRNLTKEQKQTKRKTLFRKIGLGESNTVKKNRQSRVDPNCGTAGQNKRATKQSCAKTKGK